MPPWVVTAHFEWQRTRARPGASFNLFKQAAAKQSLSVEGTHPVQLQLQLLLLLGWPWDSISICALGSKSSDLCGFIFSPSAAKCVRTGWELKILGNCGEKLQRKWFGSKWKGHKIDNKSKAKASAKVSWKVEWKVNPHVPTEIAGILRHEGDSTTMQIPSYIWKLSSGLSMSRNSWGKFGGAVGGCSITNRLS